MKPIRKSGSPGFDLEISVGERQFYAHWSILRENSVFFEEFYSRKKSCRKKSLDGKRTVDSVYLKGISGELFEKFLCYIYTNTKEAEEQQLLLKDVKDALKFSVMFELRDLSNLTRTQWLQDLEVNMEETGFHLMSELHQGVLRFLYERTISYRTKDIAKFVAREAYKAASLECLFGVLKVVSDGRGKKVEMRLKLLDIMIALFTASLDVPGRSSVAVDDNMTCALGREKGRQELSESRTIRKITGGHGHNIFHGNLVPRVLTSFPSPVQGRAGEFSERRENSRSEAFDLDRRTGRDISNSVSPSGGELGGETMAKKRQTNGRDKTRKTNHKQTKERQNKSPNIARNEECELVGGNSQKLTSETPQNRSVNTKHRERIKLRPKEKHVACGNGRAARGDEGVERGKEHVACGDEHVACDDGHAARVDERVERGEKHVTHGDEHVARGKEHDARSNEHVARGDGSFAREYTARGDNIEERHENITGSKSVTDAAELRQGTFIEQETRVIRRKIRKLWTKDKIVQTILCPEDEVRNPSEVNHSRESEKQKISKPEEETLDPSKPPGLDEDLGRVSSNVHDHRKRERLFVTGGIQKNDYFARRVILEYDPMNGVYITHDPMKTSRYNHGIAQVERELYFVGGNSGFFEQLRSVESYSIERSEWSTHTSMLEARDEFSLAVCDGFLYAIGGHNGIHDLRSVEKFSAGEECWSFVSSMRNYRAGACAVAVDNRYIYVTGGFNGHVYLNSVEQYDIAADSWTENEPMNHKRAYSCLVVLEHDIYVLGGFNGQATVSACEVYNIQTRTWSVLPDMNTPRMNATAVVFMGEVFIFGGECDSVFLETVECYNIANQIWCFVQRLPQPMAGLRACVYLEETKP